MPSLSLFSMPWLNWLIKHQFDLPTFRCLQPPSVNRFACLHGNLRLSLAVGQAVSTQQEQRSLPWCAVPAWR